ncbi:DNA-binding transcriptional regulator, MocR family, contains an aminotransferase domain [Desulfonispora thiosulfatigenes DSM 11270]|uniref:DNA-binding transcriptional regulator, MocR family, contains an aminotransferase domain n=1 Tax=Desulfonispora thiosulfatigenes DSM 11270 TaxID=656914 RepID=A0A1W1V0A2_DESTI|nr:PLP-dependent aminotransferase family protein [Desulfonispora thiosulfatigenes]SMB86785.1 DNA-binding transcriptional regulator, MocR family, contains an aminotransferase domain [Desulfonispora thiosulfatigenes DSM 11270]
MNEFVSIQLERNSKEPLYLQLSNSIYSLIEQNKLRSNAKLPAIRKLAELLKVNNSTVVNAYKHLENKNILYSQKGSGTYISPIPLEKLSTNIPQINQTTKHHVEITKDTLNLATISISPELFPVQDFKRLLNTVLDKDGGNAFNYQDSQGYLPLRESICDYLGYHNVRTTPDKIQIISGAQQGIDILSKGLLHYGDVLFVEKPTYRGAIANFQSRGAKIIEIPLEEDGIDLDVLENNMKLFHPKFIYIMSYYQNPTGISYSLEKKHALIKLANKYDTYIIEDDYLGGLNYSNEPYIPLKAFDYKNRVIYIKTFSKILMPGLRFGFIVLPQKILQSVLAAKHTTDIATSGLIQRTFDLYLRSNLWKKHIKEMCNYYQKRYELLVLELSTLSDHLSFVLPHGGLSIWVKFKNVNVEDLTAKLLSKNVLVSPASAFSLDPEIYPYIRLSFADVELERIPEAISIIKEIVQSQNNKAISIEPLL